MPVADTIVLLSVASGVFWGVSPVFSKLGMETGGSPERAGVIILLVGSVLLWGISVVDSGVGTAPASTPTDTVLVFVVSGVVGTSLAWVLWFHGIARIGAGVSNVVFYSQPLFAAVLAAVVLGERLTLPIVAGVVLIVSGVTLVSGAREEGVDAWSLTSLLFPLGAAVFGAVSSVINRYGFETSSVGALEAATINVTSALPVLVAYAIATDRRSLVGFDRSDRYFVAAGFANVAAVIGMFAALSDGPVVVVSPLVGTAPLFTAILAYFVLGDVERITARTFVSAALTVGGVSLIALG